MGKENSGKLLKLKLTCRCCNMEREYKCCNQH